MNATRLVVLALAIGVVTGFAGPAAPARQSAGGTRPAKAARPMVLPWIADDFSRAIAEARARQVPLFIESWAPW